jgi:phospholipid-translocating ATPase
MSGKPPATKRLRWATQRRPGAEGRRKRDTIMRALSMRRAPEKDEADLQHIRASLGSQMQTDAEAEEDLSERRIFVNQPLPADLVDEEGAPLQQFARNKIRTARYTPLIFIPKNLWLQFHNVANVYFLFVTILQVGPPTKECSASRLNSPCRYSRYLVLRILDSAPCL